MTDILYYMIIKPLELMLELIFVLMYRLFGNAGYAIIAVSLAVNFLILPLYKKSDAMQEEEREKQQQMSGWVKHIRKTFKGDERFMMLSAYYKEQNYQPVYALKGSLSLLLQIPFLMAAYTFLSGADLLQGCSFGILQDLGKPDQLIRIGEHFFNLLPLLMTVINFVSGAIYMRGAACKEKAQLYILALFFLVFLYDCPSGLVFYWTLNNAFSLGKNIFMKIIPNPHKVFGIVSSLFGFLPLLYTASAGQLTTGKRVLFVIAFLCLAQLPLIFYIGKNQLAHIRSYMRDVCGTCKVQIEDKQVGTLFAVSVTAAFVLLALSGKLASPKRIVFSIGVLCLLYIMIFYYFYWTNRATVRQRHKIVRISVGRLYVLGSIFVVVLLGALIPLSVIQESPTEFIDMNNYVNPLQYVMSTVALCTGIFFVWGLVVYWFGSSRVKRIWTFLVCGSGICFILNYMLFSRNFGNLSPQLQFERLPVYRSGEIVMNLLINVIVLMVILYFYNNKKNVVKSALEIMTLCCITMSILGCVHVNRTLNTMDAVIDAKNRKVNDEPVIELSRTGENIVVFMLDRQIGAMLPYIMDEKPELKNSFTGFTFYPNTISFGPCTNYGAPPIFGGYEYTPAEMNKRTKESLEKKTDEALKVMPVLFSENGYNVTVCDPPYAGYSWYPDLSIYEEYEDIKAYHCESGEYLHMLSEEELASLHPELPKRNFFYYSLFKAAPLFAQTTIYDFGNYYSAITDTINQEFLNHYAFLKNMSVLTKITDTEKAFVMLQNASPHEQTLLAAPDCVPSADNHYTNNGYDRTVDGRTMKLDYGEDINPLAHYDVNMASMIQVSKWIDYLKKEGVYDNTRIILVADHGKNWGQFEDFKIAGIDVEEFNPLLMMKDFNDNSEFSVSHEFMTNADVPTFAVEGVISDPVNPFTGRQITNDVKKMGPLVITTSGNHKIEDNHGNVFDTKDAPWYTIQSDIFEEENWHNLGPDNAIDKFLAEEDNS